MRVPCAPIYPKPLQHKAFQRARVARVRPDCNEFGHRFNDFSQKPANLYYLPST